MKMSDDELFAKLNKVFNKLYDTDDSENDSTGEHGSTERLNVSSDTPCFDDTLSSLFDDDDFDDLDNTIILNDENGEEVPFEFLDLLEYDGEEYVVLLPKDESDDTGEVVILKVDETDSEDEEAYSSVDNEETLQAVFNIFREKFKDEFNFEE